MINQWQKELQEGYRNVEALLDDLNINSKNLNLLYQSNFPLKVPRSFAQRIEKGNPNDPLLLQILPQLQENINSPHFFSDAVGDLSASKSRGVIQKYHGRVLVIMTGACAVHCRYCFRRHFPYENQVISASSKEFLFKLIHEDPTIEELIFSGGDPLLLTNDTLQSWAQEILSIPQIKRWRLHSRLLSVLPSRFDEKLLQILNEFQKQGPQVILVSHFNHSNEINQEVIDSIKRLRETGITLLNQSVLLKGINDNAFVLAKLSQSLFENGILPYYLHLLDRTQGTQHFEVSDENAKMIYHDLSCKLPGYLVPKLVREEQGMPFKSRM